MGNNPGKDPCMFRIPLRLLAALAIVGMASFWFNFIGINLLVSGLHSYAGV